MISYIKGLIAKKGLDYLIVENNGLGYFVNTSFSTLKMLNEGDSSCIFTYMHIREDILALYGFLSVDELEMFKKLISVNGVGPKAGLAVLSTYDINTVKTVIFKDDAVKMSKVPGIGKKTASKIILELKDKVGSIEETDADSVGSVFMDSEVISGESSDIIKVLMTLGFSQPEARKAIDRIDTANKSENDIIKEALKLINS